MKIINIEQGSSSWLSWRKTVITATEASIILGNNPWETPYTLWQRKLGLIEEKKSNEAMERGKRLEPAARLHFIERYNLLMVPQVVESTEYDFLGASLDGMDFDTNTILEIKCGGSHLHDMAARGEIPQYYRDQMQHQLLVTGATMCYYYSFNGTDGICIEVLPDPSFKDNFLPKARTFWKCIAFEEAPPLQEKDYKDRSDNTIWKKTAEEYQSVCEQIDNLEELKSSLRCSLIRMCEDQNSCGHGIKVMNIKKKGRVNYDAIPELNNVDLDKYRKSPTSEWKITLVD